MKEGNVEKLNRWSVVKLRNSGVWYLVEGTEALWSLNRGYARVFLSAEEAEGAAYRAQGLVIGWHEKEAKHETNS